MPSSSFLLRKLYLFLQSAWGGGACSGQSGGPRRQQGRGDCVHGAAGLTLASQVGMVTRPLPLAELNLTPSCPLATLLGPESQSFQGTAAGLNVLGEPVPSSPNLCLLATY